MSCSPVRCRSIRPCRRPCSPSTTFTPFPPRRPACPRRWPPSSCGLWPRIRPPVSRPPTPSPWSWPAPPPCTVRAGPPAPASGSASTTTSMPPSSSRHPPQRRRSRAARASYRPPTSANHPSHLSFRLARLAVGPRCRFRGTHPGAAHTMSRRLHTSHRPRTQPHRPRTRPRLPAAWAAGHEDNSPGADIRSHPVTRIRTATVINRRPRMAPPYGRITPPGAPGSGVPSSTG